jgi:hypothetical protein
MPSHSRSGFINTPPGLIQTKSVAVRLLPGTPACRGTKAFKQKKLYFSHITGVLDSDAGTCTRVSSDSESAVAGEGVMMTCFVFLCPLVSSRGGGGLFFVSVSSASRDGAGTDNMLPVIANLSSLQETVTTKWLNFSVINDKLDGLKLYILTGTISCMRT